MWGFVGKAFLFLIVCWVVLETAEIVGTEIGKVEYEKTRHSVEVLYGR